MQTKTIETKLPTGWDTTANKAVSETQPLEVPFASTLQEVVAHFDNDEAAFLTFVNSALLDRAKRNAYQSALAKYRPSDLSEDERIRKSVFTLVRMLGISEEAARAVVMQNLQRT